MESGLITGFNQGDVSVKEAQGPGCTEMFVCGGDTHVFAVTEWDGSPIGDGSAGPVTTAVWEMVNNEALSGDYEVIEGVAVAGGEQAAAGGGGGADPAKEMVSMQRKMARDAAAKEQLEAELKAARVEVSHLQELKIQLEDDLLLARAEGSMSSMVGIDHKGRVDRRKGGGRRTSSVAGDVALLRSGMLGGGGGGAIEEEAAGGGGEENPPA